MNTILVEQRHILEYIKDMLNDIKMGSYIVSNAEYHHNASYSDATSICRYGILTMMDLKNLGIRNYSEETLTKMNDVDSHVNGINSVSLSVVGLQDLYSDEFEYDPFSPSQVDFLISSNIKARRTTTNYGNEFLSYGSIAREYLKSLDIRLLKLAELGKKNVDQIQEVIEKYNYLKAIAGIIKQLQIDIPLREMSNQDNALLDIDRLASMPTLKLKKDSDDIATL